MRKHLTISLMALAAFAFVLSPITSVAGPSCGAKSNSVTKTTSADKSTCSAKNHTISAKGKSCCAGKGSKACAGHDLSKCAAKFGMSEEECKALCADYTMIKMDIEGMTCGNCEKIITTSLENLKGVKKVAHVSHEKGLAVLFVDSKQIEDQTLINAVTNKGFKAQMAVVKVNNSTDKSASLPTCSGHKKAAAKSTGSTL